jgi:hypothetical protein
MSFFLPLADRSEPVLQVCFTVSPGNVSPHLQHSSKTHESRAMMRRWKLGQGSIQRRHGIDPVAHTVSDAD